MTFRLTASLVLLVLLQSLGIREAYAGECLNKNLCYRKNSDSVEWRIPHYSDRRGSGVHLETTANAMIKLISLPQFGQVTIGRGSAFSYIAKADFQDKNSLTVGVSDAVDKMNGTSNIYQDEAASRLTPLALPAVAVSSGPADSDTQPEAKGDHRMLKMDKRKFEDWRSRWEKGIILEAQGRFCETALGEEIGWLVSPILSGYYYGYLATSNTRWIDQLISCADAWIRRAVKEPDGHEGWPKLGAAGTNVDHLDDFFADSMLGEAMALQPIILMSNKLIRTPMLAEKYGAKANAYIRLSEEIFDKWNSRGAWRETGAGGIISVVLPFGIDRTKGIWTAGYEARNDAAIGFSHPNNKANLIAGWLLAMFDATQKPLYRDRAEKWFQVMKSRMKLKEDGTYRIWNYWEPAGLWDYSPNGVPKHWVGVHPNSGYYDIDIDSIVTAYEHRLIFSRHDINSLIATALTEKRYWTGLVPYDDTIQRQFEETLDPSSWRGHSRTPWYLALELRNGLLP